jgi:tyrosinase
MTISRRNVMLQGCVIGAGVMAANVPGIVAFAQAQPKLRRSLLGMPLNDPIISAWRDAVRMLKEPTRPAPINWTSLANIHGTTAGFNQCPHGNWYFLPWHRGYLLMYERVVRQLTGFNDFALPYWDWTADSHVPEAFTSPTLGGNPNALFEPRDMGPSDTIPAENVGQAVMTQILNGTPFETFGTTRPSGQNSLDPMWIRRRTGAQGTLEANPHNNVHGWVGGVMAGTRSANDPIFMMHHGNIDRIWWVWNGIPNPNTNDTLWTDMPFQNHFFNPDGTPYSPKVSDLRLPEPLGYTYDPEIGVGPVVGSGPGTATPIDEKLKTIYGSPNLEVAAAPGIATYVAPVSEAATSGKPLDVSIKVDPSKVGVVARYRRPSTGTEAVDPGRVRARLAAAPRALCFIRDIAVANDENTQYRVFVDCDYLSASTPISDRHYAGTFGFFGTHNHGGEANPSVAVDLTVPVQRVYGSLPTSPESIRVQILPVARGKGGEIGMAKPSRVEIAIITA